MASVVTGTPTATGYVKNILVRGYEKRKKPKTLFMYIIDLKWEPERVTTVLRSHPELLEFHVSHYPHSSPPSSCSHHESGGSQRCSPSEHLTAQVLTHEPGCTAGQVPLSRRSTWNRACDSVPPRYHHTPVVTHHTRLTCIQIRKLVRRRTRSKH